MGRLATFALMAFLPVGLAAQQTLTLKDGTQFRGRMTAGSSQSITFQDANGERHRYDVSEVQSITFTDNANTYNNNGTYNNSSSNNDSGAYNNGRRNRNDVNRNGGYNDGTNSAGSRTIPSGTELVVRTNETIDSTNATEGRTYSAQLNRDVMDSNGAVLIPRGSDVQLVIRSMSQGGTLSSGNLALDLQSVNVNGRRYLVSTQDLQRGGTGIGKNRRTAEMVGGGAALGTLLGAIAGGGKGAVIGAIAGAAAGGGVEVLTKGKNVKVPAETVLTFRLDEPMQLQPY